MNKHSSLLHNRITSFIVEVLALVLFPSFLGPRNMYPYIHIYVNTHAHISRYISTSINLNPDWITINYLLRSPFCITHSLEIGQSVVSGETFRPSLIFVCEKGYKRTLRMKFFSTKVRSCYTRKYQTRLRVMSRGKHSSLVFRRDKVLQRGRRMAFLTFLSFFRRNFEVSSFHFLILKIFVVDFLYRHH